MPPENGTSVAEAGSPRHTPCPPPSPRWEMSLALIGGMPMSGKDHRHLGLSKEQKQDEQPREKMSRPFSPSDFEKVGPRSIDGVEASDLPDKGRGSVETNPGKELRRKLPQTTGAIGTGDDVGIRAEPDVADAQDHGHRKKN